MSNNAKPPSLRETFEEVFSEETACLQLAPLFHSVPSVLSGPIKYRPGSKTPL